MAIDVLFAVKADIESDIAGIQSEDVRQQVLADIALRQGYTNPDITTIEINECKRPNGWILHRCRVKSRQHAISLKNYLETRLEQLHGTAKPIRLIHATWVGTDSEGLPLHKEYVRVTDPQTGETVKQVRVRKDDQGQDETNPIPLDSDLQTFFFYPERTVQVDDGQGGTIDVTLPATTDVNRISDTPRAYGEN